MLYIAVFSEKKKKLANSGNSLKHELRSISNIFVSYTRVLENFCHWIHWIQWKHFGEKSNIITVNFFSEIGEGWAPALLNSQAELDFIFRSHSHTDLQRYWIGGYTEVSAGRTITLSDYLTTEAGNHTSIQESPPT